MSKGDPKPRGRPRSFDCEAGISIAQHLFEERGYGGVSVADLTAAIGINPPSFYAAYGSKAELFARAMARYSASGVPVKAILTPDRSPAEALAEVLDDAARRYSHDPRQLGCLVIETTHSEDAVARCAANALSKVTADAIHAFVARTHPAQADAVADYMSTVMIGLSAMARAGTPPARLVGVARAASLTLTDLLPVVPKVPTTARRRPKITRESTRRR